MGLKFGATQRCILLNKLAEGGKAGQRKRWLGGMVSLFR